MAKRKEVRNYVNSEHERATPQENHLRWKQNLASSADFDSRFSYSRPQRYVRAWYDGGPRLFLNETMSGLLKDTHIAFYEREEIEGGTLRFRISITNNNLYYLLSIVTTLWVTHFEILYSKASAGPEIHFFSSEQFRDIATVANKII